jgi:hypothetical protein
MSYDYKTERSKLFSEDGVSALMKVRENANKCIRASGAVMSSHLMQGASDTWTALAAMDYLVEIGDLKEVTNKSVMGQHRVFVRPADYP